MPVPAQQWRAPSLAQPKDQFGNPDLTLWRITGRLHDGHPVWVGWFEDRDDADAFLLALIVMQHGGPRVPRELWELPNKFTRRGFPDRFRQERISNNWHPDLVEHVVYYAVDTVVTFTSPTGSLQSYSKPSDFPNGAHNNVQLIASGGRGGAQNSAAARAGGGAGAEWGQYLNFSFTGASAQYQIGALNTASSVGPSSWWDGTSDTSCSLSALGGNIGQAINGSGATAAGGVGGTGGVGPAHNHGGDGANGGTGGTQGGGGAAGDPSGPGDSAVNLSATGATGDGINSGGGGNGGKPAGDGKNYGGGGGGSASSTGAVGGNGAQGLIVVTYTPVSEIYTQLERGTRGLLRGVTLGTMH